MILSFILWNGSPEIFSAGQITLRWYGLLFALGFLLSQQLLTYIYRKEGKPEKEVDTLTIVMVIATILGARLGHVIFYQPEIFTENPLGVLLPFEFEPKFRFTGLQGLASHGGAFAILLGLWWYARRKKQSYLGILDRMVILVALTGACIRLGNFFNSEIVGKPTDLPWGVVFTNRLSQGLEYQGEGKNPVDFVGFMADTTKIRRDSTLLVKPGATPVTMYVFFKPDVQQDDMVNWMSNPYQPYERKLKNYLAAQSEFFYDSPLSPTSYSFAKQENNFVARVHLIGIARHPAQLYESISCLILFVFLFWYWNKYKNALPEGRLFGIFMTILWGLRFTYEFIKENQEAFENELPLNMGQLLSIPLFIVGLIILRRSYNSKSAR